jgi:hypothetical protein
MQMLQKKILNTYIKNLDFLKTNFEELSKKISLLDIAIENGSFTTTYELVYDEQGSYFDIEYIKDNNRYYGTSSIKHASELKENCLNNSFKILKKEDDKKIFSTLDIYKPLLPLVETINKTVDFDNVSYNKIYKYIFFGSGLGYHIQDIFNNLEPLNTLIMEPNLEIFRLSLFVTDYSQLHIGDHQLFLSIAEDFTYTRATLDYFYKIHSDLNFEIPFNLLSSDYRYLVDDAVNYFSIETMKINLIDFDLRTIKRTLQYNENGYKFLEIDRFETLEPINQPILVISAGPSLDRSLQWIRENQNNFFIIAIHRTVAKLLENEIRPNLLVAGDPADIEYDFLKDINDTEMFANTPILISSHVVSKIPKMFKKDNVYIYGAAMLFSNSVFAGNNVGMVALSAAIELKPSAIYTIGNDAAFDNDTGNIYSDGMHFNAKAKEDTNNNIGLFSTIKTKGNLSDTVETNRKLLDFKLNAEGHLASLKQKIKNIKMYNLSYGAYIEGLEPIIAASVVFDNTKIDNKVFLDKLEKSSVIYGQNKFEKEIGLLTMLRSKAQIIKTKKTKDLKVFLKNRLSLYTLQFKILEDIEQFTFRAMFKFFSNISDNYINFYISVVNKKENEKIIEKLKNCWIDGYIEFLNSLIAVMKDKK